MLYVMIYAMYLYTASSSDAASERSAGIYSKDADDASCAVCMDHVINCVMNPCGHMCVCYECGKQLKHRYAACPICRENIKDVIKVYKTF
jgi:hypothetical protein